MDLNGIPLSKWSAHLMYVPISHLMKHTLMACDPAEIDNEEYRPIYAGDIWSPEKAAQMYRSRLDWSGITVTREKLFNLEMV
jgi:hypothetical protein